ncbi:MAG: MmgE/PrpD family protein [Desulfarculaceae bacterium]|nr:MmgE/PrpD family protein [Desulfarculaceae bacterium]
MSAKPSMEEAIAQRALELTYESMSPELLHLVKRSILDSYAGICGSLKDRGMLANFDRLVAAPASGADLEVWGINRKGGFMDAVFMNAILARRSDLLNTYLAPNGMGGVHPSDNLALALTLADWLKMNGRDFLTTVYTAFYLAAAFATYYNPEPAKYDHDAAATFYTALTIGKALGLSQEQLVLVQRIAGMFGLDINQAAVGQVTDWKHCTYASCALRALQAARLALAGFQAPSQIYEGAAGVNQFFPHAAAVFDPPPDLGLIVFKRWPALVFCQTPIDVALDLAPRIKDPAAIQAVEVKTYQVALRNGGTAAALHPESRAGRTHSIPYCVATALLKPIAYEDFDQARSTDPELQALLPKVAVSEDPALTQAYPAKARCEITVTLADGSTLQAARDYPKGDPNDPLPDAELEDKLRAYFFFAEDKAEVDAVIAGVWKLEEQKGLAWLTSPLKRRLI